MNSKRDHQSQCGDCGSKDSVFIFNVRYRAVYRRLCIACVLKIHAGYFCPICFEVYDPHPPPPQLRVMCLKCPSISHLSCVSTATGTTISIARYECPPCSSPSFSFFDLKKGQVNFDGDSVGNNESRTEMDKVSAKQIVAASQIAVTSMNKAVAVARSEAEKRVKEAALAKKRTKEALDRLVYLLAKEKEKKELDSKLELIGQQQNINPKLDNTCVSMEDQRIHNQRREHNESSPTNTVKVEGEKKSNGSGHLQHRESSHRKDE